MKKDAGTDNLGVLEGNEHAVVAVVSINVLKIGGVKAQRVVYEVVKCNDSRVNLLSRGF